MDFDGEITYMDAFKGIPIIQMPAAFIVESDKFSGVPLKTNGELYSTEFPSVPY